MKKTRWTASPPKRRPGESQDPRRWVRDLKAGDVGVVFQPIVDLRDGSLRAAEALVRCEWDEFARPPVLFEHAVDEAACGRLGRLIREVAFQRAPEVPLFVNIHPGELESRWLVRPDDPMNFHDQEVFLEITESATFEQFDLCRVVLREVCSRTGAHLVIDDLGAGYSNLKRIIDLQPRVVKLDITLARGLDKNRRQRLLVSHLVRLCDDLGARVVVEGIETVEELRAVRDTGASYGQGYLLAEPGFPLPDINWPL